MYDSYGDGWNGYYFSLYDENGYSLDTVTLEYGSSAYECLYVEYDKTYSFEVSTTGSYVSEIYFYLCDGYYYRSAELEFYIDDYGECTVTDSSSSSTWSSWSSTWSSWSTSGDCIDLDMYDSYGDGWNGYYFSLYDEDDGVASSATLSSGSYGEDCLSVSYGTCYTFKVSTSGSYSSEISYNLCGYYGTTSDILSICIDDYGSCYDDSTSSSWSSWTSPYGSYSSWDWLLTPNVTCTGPTLTMEDSYGDGWNSAIFELYDGNWDTLIQQVTLEESDGSYGETCIYGEQDSCYVFSSFTKGAYPSEISWELCGVEGDANTMLSFCVGENGDCWERECYGNNATLIMYDESESCDGWNGFIFSLYNGSNSVQGVTLNNGCYSFQCLPLEPEVEYVFELSESGGDGYKGELSWELCGVSGDYATKATVMIDAYGNCTADYSYNCEFQYRDHCYEVVDVEENLYDAYFTGCYLRGGELSRIDDSTTGFILSSLIDSISWVSPTSNFTNWAEGEPYLDFYGSDSSSYPTTSWSYPSSWSYSSSSSWTEEAFLEGCVGFYLSTDGYIYTEECQAMLPYVCQFDIVSDCSSLSIAKIDTTGDGWNGNEFALYNQTTDGDVIQTVTFSSGTYEETCLETQNGGCYVFKISSGGSFPSEVMWDICGVQGSYSTSISFCLDSSGKCTIVTTSDVSDEITDLFASSESTEVAASSNYEDECMFTWDPNAYCNTSDASAGVEVSLDMCTIEGYSGWWLERNPFFLYDENAALYTFNVNSSYAYNTHKVRQCLTFDAGACYGIGVGSSDFPQYQSWSLPACGIYGKRACDLAWFCLDDSGKCTEWTDRDCTDPSLGESEVSELAGCDPIYSGYYELYAAGEFGATDFTLDIDDTKNCDDIVLTVHMDWTDYGQYPSEASFSITNLDNGDTIDEWNQVTEISAGDLDSFGKIYSYCVVAGSYEFVMNDAGEDGWNRGYAHISYSSKSQNREIGSFTIIDTDTDTVFFDLYVDYFTLTLTFEWGNYPSECSFEIRDAGGDTADDIIGTEMIGVGEYGQTEFSFEISGDDMLFLNLYDSIGDGWDVGNYTVEYSYMDGQRFFLQSGSLGFGYSAVKPLFVRSELASVDKDVIFERGGSDWTPSTVASSYERHGCGCGSCDSIAGFDLQDAWNMTVSYLGLYTDAQNAAQPSYCNELNEDDLRLRVSYNFDNYSSPVVVTFENSGANWEISSVEEDYYGPQCYSESDFYDCKREKGETICYIEGNNDAQICSELDFSYCSDPDQQPYKALAGDFSGGASLGDMTCSLLIAPGLPDALTDYATLTLTIQRTNVSDVLQTVYAGVNADDTLLFKGKTNPGVSLGKNTICAGNEGNATKDFTDVVGLENCTYVTVNSTSDLCAECVVTDDFVAGTNGYYFLDEFSTIRGTQTFYISGGSARINSIVTNTDLEEVGTAPFTGSYQVQFNTSKPMKTSAEACAYSYCFDDSQGVIMSRNFTPVTYLIEKSNASDDALWLRFWDYNLKGNDNLTIYNGSTTSDEVLATLHGDWFTTEGGNSLFMNGNWSNRYAIFETEVYPTTMSMWISVAAQSIVFADERFVLSLETRSGSTKLSPKVSFDDITLGFGDVEIDIGTSDAGWTHLALNLFFSEGFVEFFVNGARVTTCQGEPSESDAATCPQNSTMLSPMASSTAGGYLLLGGQYLGPLSYKSKDELMSMFWIDELRFYKQKLDSSEIQGLYSNGSLECDFGDDRMVGCYHMDETLEGNNGELLSDGSMYGKHARSYGLASQAGVSPLNTMLSTTFASSSSHLLLKFEGNLTSSFLATYEAVKCHCKHGACERGFCVCDAGYGGETCNEWLVSEACSDSVGAIHGAEYVSSYGDLNLTLAAADYQRWKVGVYPELPTPSVDVPEVTCSWMVTRDYGVASVNWEPFKECVDGNFSFAVYDGIQLTGESKDSKLVSIQDGFDEEMFTSAEGSSGELQVEFNSTGLSWTCSEGSLGFKAMNLLYRVPRAYYVAPNNYFLTSVRTATGTSDAPYRTIQAALSVATKNDIIYLYPGRYEGTGNVGLAISSGVRMVGISGAEYTIIDAGQTSVHATISSCGDVIFEGITFMNGKTVDAGSSLYVGLGEVSLIDCWFKGNSAGTGTVYVEAPGAINVIGTTFEGNTATRASALYLDSAKVVIEGSSFIQNTAVGAGAITGSGAVVITESTMPSEEIRLVSTLFQGNQADEHGALIIEAGVSLVIEQCIFKGNVGTTKGAGVYVTGQSHLTAFNTSFMDNVGASITVNQKSTLKLTDVSISGNTEKGSELGAVDLIGTGDVHIINCLFSGNDGSIGAYNASKLVIGNSTFTEGVSKPSVSLTEKGTNAHIFDCTFSSNTAYGGAGIHLASTNPWQFILIEDCTFENNRATTAGALARRGGAIYNSFSKMKVTGCTFTDNYARQGGALYISSTHAIEIMYSTFTGDSSIGDGGAIYLDTCAEVKLQYVDFTGCKTTSVGDGGAMYLDATVMELRETNFTGCSCDSNGGAILMTGDTCSISAETTQFFGNSGPTGGAISVRSGSTLTFVGGEFRNNNATDGGALAVQEGSYAYFSDGTIFADNSASEDGGAFFLVRLDYGSVSKFIIDGAVFERNVAAGLGGAMYFALCDSMTVRDMNTTLNQAETGGAIATLASSLTIYHSNMKNLLAVQGGALYILHSTFEMYGTTLGYSNVSVDNGGLMYAFASDLVVDSSQLLEGSADDSGGAIFLFDSPITIGNSLISGSRATDLGGGIYTTGTDEISIFNCIIEGNQALDGGAIYATDTASFLVRNSEISSNIAGENGGGLYILQSKDVDILNTTYTDNYIVLTSTQTTSPTYGGGALRVSEIDDLNIKSCDFNGNGGSPSQNKSSYSFVGGAMLTEFSAALITDCSFEGNTAYSGGGIYFGDEYFETNVAARKLEVHHHRSILSTNAFGMHRLGTDFSGSLIKTRSKYHLQRAQDRTKHSLERHEVTRRELSTVNSIVKLVGSSFSGNNAEMGGGAVIYTQVEPNGLKNNTYSSNTASFGGDFTSPATHIVAIHSGDPEQSGYEVSKIVVELRDEYDQVVGSENSATVFCTAVSAETSVTEQTSVTFQEGVATFTGLIVSRYPGTVANISFTTTAVDGKAYLNFTLRGCDYGEVLLEGSTSCTECPFGTFSIVKGETACHTCPDGAVCYGKTSIRAKRGYWRFANTTGVCNEENIHDDCYFHECGTASACRGDIMLSDTVEIFTTDNVVSNKLIISTNAGTSIQNSLETNCLLDGNYHACELMLSGIPVALGDGTDALSVASDSVVMYVDEATQNSADFAALGLSGTPGELYIKVVEECDADNGYTGNVCARCLSGFYRISTVDYSCAVCPDLTLSYVVLCAGIIAFIIASVILIALQLRKHKKRAKFGDVEVDKASIMLKIFTSYMQLVSLFSALELNWPEITLDMFRYQSFAKAGEQLINLDCVFNQISAAATGSTDENYESVFYQRFLFFMVLPLGVIIGTALFWSLMYFHKKLQFARKKWDYHAAGVGKVADDGKIDKDEVKPVLEALGEEYDDYQVNLVIEVLGLEAEERPVEKFQSAYLYAYGFILKEKWLLSVVVLLFLVHPNVAQYTFFVFTCKKLSTTRSFLEQDLDTECETNEHNMWRFAVGIPFMLVYTVGIPAFGGYVLFLNRFKLGDFSTKLKYGFLYEGYELDYYYWEIWVMVRKIMVTFVTVFIAPYGQMSEALSGLVIGIVSLVLHLKCQPYEYDDLDTLETASLYATVITLVSGLFFFSGEMSDSGETFFIIVIIAANLAFCAYFVLAISREYKKKAVAAVVMAAEKVVEAKSKTNQSKHDKKLLEELGPALDEIEFKYTEASKIQDEITMNTAEILAAEKIIAEKAQENEEAAKKLEKMQKDLYDQIKDVQHQTSENKNVLEEVWDKIKHAHDIAQDPEESKDNDIEAAQSTKEDANEAIMRLYNTSKNHAAEVERNKGKKSLVPKMKKQKDVQKKEDKNVAVQPPAAPKMQRNDVQEKKAPLVPESMIAQEEDKNVVPTTDKAFGPN